ncbi:MAG: T9SS C-terminal target domain-containing protein [Ignavibacteriales bacterium]|nr:MAG: T9SS C-terminal target domain-containing protein [Ignavibacteriales bacterium]
MFKKTLLYFIIFIFSSVITKAQWHQVASIPGEEVSLLANANDLYAYSESGLFRSTDEGVSWVSLNQNLVNRNINSLLIIENNLFVASFSGVFKSTDNGQTWESISNGLSNNGVYALVCNETMIFAAASGKNVYSMQINSNQWSEANTGITNKSTFSLAIKGNTIFAGAYDFGDTNHLIFRSTNNGSNWTSIINGYPAKKSANTFCVYGSSLLVGTAGRGIYRTTDDGDQWTPINNGLATAHQEIKSIIAYGNSLFAATWDGGVYLSTNEGESWNQINEGLTDKTIFSLTVQDGYLYAGSLYEDGHIWKRDLSEIITSVEDISTSFPNNFILEQNYPNPFNPSTTVEYEITKPENVKINIYDVNGRMIKELLKEQKDTGRYSVVWNGKDDSGKMVASGNYFYQIICGDFAQAKKMILLK